MKNCELCGAGITRDPFICDNCDKSKQKAEREDIIRKQRELLKGAFWRMNPQEDKFMPARERANEYSRIFQEIGEYLGLLGKARTPPE